MFRKTFGFGRKSSNDSRQSRFQRTASQSPSPNSSPSGVSIPASDGYIGSITSLPQLPEISVATSLQSRKRSGHSRRGPEGFRKEIEPDPGPLGLNVIYTPQNGHKADVVFIHGLGGTSRLTWSKHKDPELFWPLTFLPLEPDICLARILTFAYNANFRKASNVNISVLDFAKDLLFDLKYARDEFDKELNMGNVPLIFVVHSMGGLVIKEAYMQGQNDPEYESIVRAISSIVFLATPHRGTNLAETLKRILQSTIVTNSKQYISDLSKNSLTLQRLNEQFRHIAPRLDIVSFYETQPTPIGLKRFRITVLEKDSSVLGYPGEISKALNADHHGVCKYDSPRDPNYVTVRNVIQSLVKKTISSSESNRRPSKKPPSLKRKGSLDLKFLLSIAQLPDIDYMFFRDQWVQGTNDWVLEDNNYLQWLHHKESTRRLLWLNGGAATGKSVLASFIINKLVEQGASCQYFFLRFGDQKKTSLSPLLRSIAYQVAQSVPTFLDRVLTVVDEGIDLETADPRTIWERLFKSSLFSLEEPHLLYWVIDGLDEADDPRAIIRLLSDIPSSSVQVRVVLVGRNTSEISGALQRVPKGLDLSSINIEGHFEDIRCYIDEELVMPGSVEFKENIAHRLVDGAQNNFLWVRLAVDKLNMCHTHADVELALLQLPSGMEALYDRMALSIVQKPSLTDKALALAMLQSVTCSLRALTVAELSQALDEDSSEMLDFQRSVVDLCGGFVVVDNDGNVAMIHQTAREYLLDGKDRPFRVDHNAAHKQMFLSCMRCLMATGLRAKINRNEKPEFLSYAATSWSSHLASAPVNDGQVITTLNNFLTGSWILTWIRVLAISKQLRVLVRASRHLSKYSVRRNKNDAAQNDRGMLIMEQELLESWAVDFVKILGKFGIILRRNPGAVCKSIPPLCPRSSSIYQLFGKTESKSLMVSGLAAEKWDDSLARISLGFSDYASSISAAGAQIAILASGNVFIYDSSTFEEAKGTPIKHGERLYRMEMNNTGSLLATYGYRTTKIWEIPTGKCRLSVENIESRPRPLAMLLTNNDSTLIVGSEDRRVRSLSLNQSSPSWQLVAELEEPELEGHFLNSSSHIALNSNGSLITVAYRGHPLSAWETDGPLHIGHCWRKREEIARGEVIEAVWHPHSPEVLGLYIEGVVFKWRPYDGESTEIATRASRLAISRDGNLFATGDVHGAVKVYTTSDFCLLYHLTSQDNVLGLAFNPDPHRFYDIRGHYANAWEPNALMKFTERTGNGNERESEVESDAQNSTASMSWSHRIDSITVLSGSPTGRLYCYGTETGLVTLNDTLRGSLANLHKSKGFFSIEKMNWSDDGQHFCFSDLCRNVFIMSITADTSHSDPIVELNAQVSMKNDIDGPISQLLFRPDSSSLLVCASEMISIISLASSSATHSLEFQAAKCKWVIHPLDPSLIVGVEPGAVHVLDWSLVKRQTYTFEYASHPSLPLDQSDPPVQDVVDQVLVTLDKKHVLVQISLSSESSKEKTFLYFDTSILSTATTRTQPINHAKPITTVTPIVLPENLSSQIASCLSILSQNRLIFLSKTFAICSLQLSSDVGTIPSSLSTSNPNSTAKAVTTSTSLSNRRPLNHDKHGTSEKWIKEIFPLPGDWISRDCLALCSIWGIERSLLCPRNGELAVVRCTALV